MENILTEIERENNIREIFLNIFKNKKSYNLDNSKL